MQSDTIDLGLTFDDILLLPARSEVLPSDVSLETILTRNITLGIPLYWSGIRWLWGMA